MVLKHYCETTGCVYIVIYCTEDIDFSESLSFVYKDSHDLTAKNEFCINESAQGLFSIQYNSKEELYFKLNLYMDE